MSQKFLTQIDMQNNQVVGLPAVQDAADQATSKAFVESAISTAIANLVDSAPELLNTLNEIAAALGDDENFATTITNAINNFISDLSTADNSAKGATLVGVYDPDNKLTATTVNAALIELRDAISTSGTDITDLLTEISNARNGYADLDSRLDDADSTVSGIDGRLVTAEGEIDTLQSDVDAVELEISNARGGSVDLETRLDGIDSTVSGIDGRLITAEGEIDTLQSDVDAVELEISNARGGEVDLDTRLDGIDSNISNLQSDKTDKHSADIGDGSATSFVINHSLDTRDVVVTVRENSSPYAVVITDIEITSTTSVTVKFATAPSSNQYRVVIVG